MRKLTVVSMCLLLLVSCASLSKTKEKKRRSAQVVHQTGKVFFAQAKYSLALKKFLEAEKVIPDDLLLQYDIGFVYLIKKKYDLAEIHFKKTLQLQSDFVPAMNALGTIYIKQQKWDEAIKYLMESIESLIYSTPQYPLTNLGWAYLGKKNYKLAEGYFLKALKIAPNYSGALHGYATVSLLTHNEHKAIKKLEKAVKKYPDSLIINYDLARILDNVGLLHKAQKYWEKVSHLAPEESKFKEEAENRL